MKGIILAAGEGTRLRPLTLTRPKPMLPIGGRPLLEHNVVLMRTHGLSEIAINLHYLPNVVTDYFGDGEKWQVSLHYSHEETLLGSAGAIKKIENFFDDTFVMLYGDLFTNIDLTAMIQHHKLLNAQVTMAVHEVDNPCEKGIVALNDQGWITRFMEKPKPEQVFSNLVNAGVYVIEPEILQWIEPNIVCDFGHDVFPWLIENNKRVAGYQMNDFLLDIGSPTSYEQAQEITSFATIVTR